MKGFVYILFASLLFLSSCAEWNNNVRLVGRVEGGINDGDTVYLMLPDGNNVSRVVAKDAVTDGCFELAGNVDLPAMCIAVTVAADGSIARKMNFIAEGGDVAMTVLPAYYRVAGTPLNDKLQTFRDSMEIASRIYKRYYDKKAETPTLSSMGVKEANDVMSIALYQYRKVLYNAIENNIGNILAAHLIKEHIDIIEPVQGLLFIRRIPREYKDNVIAYIGKLYAAQEKTAPGASFVDFSMSDVEGVQHSLSAYAAKGKQVLVCAWMSGEGKSAAAQRAMCSLREEMGEGLEIIGVSIDRNYNVWRSSVLKDAMCGIQLSDLKGWNSAFLSLYGIDKVPYYVLIDATGVITYRGTSLDAVSKLLK